MDENFESCEMNCCAEDFEESICIPVKEYKKLVRCEISLGLILAVNQNHTYSTDVDRMINLVAKMHPDLVPAKEVDEDA